MRFVVCEACGNVGEIVSRAEYAELKRKNAQFHRLLEKIKEEEVGMKFKTMTRCQCGSSIATLRELRGKIVFEGRHYIQKIGVDE